VHASRRAAPGRRWGRKVHMMIYLLQGMLGRQPKAGQTQPAFEHALPPGAARASTLRQHQLRRRRMRRCQRWHSAGAHAQAGGGRGRPDQRRGAARASDHAAAWLSGSLHSLMSAYCGRAGALPRAHRRQRRGAGPGCAPRRPGLAGGVAAAPLGLGSCACPAAGVAAAPMGGRRDRCGRPPALSCCARRCSPPGRAAGRRAARGSPPAAPWPPQSARRPPAGRSCVMHCIPRSA